MPERIKPLPQEFFDNIDKLSFQEIAYHVADCFFGEDVDSESLRAIVYDTLQFDCPVVKVTDNIYTLELFHGPTLAFKDVGARFMARLLQYFLKRNGSYVSGSTDKSNNNVNVLVATSGDTGSAVANGFLGVECIFTWYWVADFCAERGIDFALGHAYYMKSIHGGKTKSDKIDSEKIANMLRGGMFRAH